MTKRRKPQRHRPGRLTDFAPNCDGPMHQFVMLAGRQQAKEATEAGCSAPA